jgi:hypothetical protein
MSTWKDAQRPGYFGARRDEIHAGYTERYGSGNWRLVWRIGEYTGNRRAATLLYSDAYAQFLEREAEVLDELVKAACEVYDDAPSTVGSGLDFEAQESPRTHLQDIAIRQSLVRLGRWFEGKELLQIRDSLGIHPLSMTLSPGRVPFHRRDLICQPELEGWWQAGSVESFYQSNKLLQVRS